MFQQQKQQTLIINDFSCQYEISTEQILSERSSSGPITISWTYDDMSKPINGTRSFSAHIETYCSSCSAKFI